MSVRADREHDEAIASAAAPPWSVAVLCAAPRARAAAGAVALALARVHRVPCALAAVGGVVPPSTSLSPAALRAAAAARAGGCGASAVGRVVWVGADADREPETDDAEPTGEGTADDGGAVRDPRAFERIVRALARAGERADLPAVAAVSCARGEEVDRVLARFDALALLPEPTTPRAIATLARESLAALGRPVAELPVPSRWAERLARAGLVAPEGVFDAIARLGMPGAGS